MRRLHPLAYSTAEQEHPVALSEVFNLRISFALVAVIGATVGVLAAGIAH